MSHHGRSRARDQNRKIKLGVCLKGRRRKDKQRLEGTVDKGIVFVAGEEESSMRDQKSL